MKQLIPLALILALAPLARADEAADRAEYDRLVAAAAAHAKIDNAMRVRLACLQALQLRPDGVEAWLRLASVSSGDERQMLLIEARRRWPDEARVTEAVGDTRLPEIKRFGRATRVAALYLGRSKSVPPIGVIAPSQRTPPSTMP